MGGEGLMFEICIGTIDHSFSYLLMGFLLQPSYEREGQAGC